MQKAWREFVERVSKLSPLAQCVLIVSLSSILVLIMLYPTAGVTLTSFLMSFCLLFKQARRGRQ